MIKIRKEEEKDYPIVENIIREAFWNLYKPGADVHLVVHKLRSRSECIHDLCLVAEENDQIVGYIMFSRSIIEDPKGKQHSIPTMGPIGVLPSKHGKGIGSALIKRSIELAKELGFKSMILLGYPSYYHRFGFENSHPYGISMQDLFIFLLIPEFFWQFSSCWLIMKF